MARAGSDRVASTLAMQLGAQLYTIRRELGSDLLPTLKLLRGFGYRYVELAGTNGHTVSKYQKALDKAELQPVSMHYQLALDGSNLKGCLAEAKAFGVKYIVLPWIPKEEYESGWPQVGERLTGLGEKIQAAGYTFCYHHHAFEFELEANGEIGLDNMFEAANPDFVKAEMDTYWIEYAGFDATSEMRKRKGRLPLLHIKDMKNIEEKGFCAPGTGVLSWPAIVFTAYEAGVRYAFVEIDEPENGVHDLAVGLEKMMDLRLTP